MQTTLVSSIYSASRAAATVRTAGEMVHVLDLDGSYRSVGDELVVSPVDVGLSRREVAARSLVMGSGALERWAQAQLVRYVLADAPEVLALSPGVLVRRDPTDLHELVRVHGLVLVGRTGACDDGTWPGLADVEQLGSYSASIVGIGRQASQALDTWETLAVEEGERWLDVLAGRHPHHVVRNDLVASAWSRSIDLSACVAIDLSTLDTTAPWLLDRRATATPRIRLSDRADLAAVVTGYVEEVGAERTVPSVSSVGAPVHPHLVSLVRSAVTAGASFETVPDIFDPDQADELATWLSKPATGSGGVGRYLSEVYAARPDLRAAFPNVADHAHDLHEWGASVGLADLETASAPPEAARGPRRAGVNVVGYLSGELGVGESARLMLSAIGSGGVPHTTFAVTKNLRSRQNASFQASSSAALFDTTLLCVNATEAQSVSASLPTVVKDTYRIGMWYWETSDFPRSQRKGFRHVDEVWVATDFIRSAVEPHSPVPVRTILPPLPQPRAGTDQAAARVRMGLPDRPILLFAFDYASIAERKNPWGLIDAFESAFTPGEGPLLVVKSINGDRKPAQAERLRLRVQDSPDILLIEEYLDADERDALMEACDCYVSLHRSEGLGLTMAEAMAFGKPVIASAYGGNLQFMTDSNSFLVPTTPIAIPRGSGPYATGAMWADPDLRVAAQLMRAVVDDPVGAAQRGQRAVKDLRDKHSPEVAGRAVVQRLAEIRAERATDAPRDPRSLRAVARRLRHR